MNVAQVDQKKAREWEKNRSRIMEKELGLGVNEVDCLDDQDWEEVIVINRFKSFNIHL